MSKIESLTEEQKSALKEWRADWHKIGISVEPADRITAQKSITEMYKIIGKSEPKFIWVDSPMTANLMYHLLQQNKLWQDCKGGNSLGASLWGSLWASLRASMRESLEDSLDNSLRDSLRESLWDSLGDSLMGSLWDSLDNSLRDSLRESLGASLRDSLWESLRDSLRESLGASLRDSLRYSLRSSLGDSLRGSLYKSLKDSLEDSLEESLWGSLEDSMGESLRGSLWESMRELLGDSKIEIQHTWMCGQQDSYWIAFYLFCRDVVGVKYNSEKSAHLDLWANIARSSGWWYPYEGVCIICERPKHVRMDSQERIHDYSLPAVEFRDGWRVYAIHGVRVPEKYVLTPADKINPEEVLKESNAEIRTAVIKKCGFAHFRKHINSKVVSSSNNNELIEFDLGNQMKVRGLLVRWTDKHDSKETILPVPRTREQFESTGDVPSDIDDCESVRKWTLFAKQEDTFVAET